MNTPKHTPGPYAVDLHLPTNQPCVVTKYEYGEGRIVAVCTNTVYAKQDANLIAAAPELLEAAKQVLKDMYLVDRLGTKPNVSLQALYDAINKAEGRNTK